MSNHPSTASAHKPQSRWERQFQRILTPFDAFVRHQATAGVLLIVATLAALVLANSGLKQAYVDLLDVQVGLSVGHWSIEKSLLHWVNEGLMALFFFLLGLEIKRQLLVGHLRDKRRALLVLCAALGGMLVPAGIYTVLNPNGVAVNGWAIPMATDTAFALGAMTLLGTRVPRSLVAFLAALAIVDDIGAVLVIAVFYSDALDPAALALAVGFFVALLTLNSAGVKHAVPYAVVGVLLWYWVVQAGVHGTVAGVLVAAATPARAQHSPRRFRRGVSSLMERFRRGDLDQQHAMLDSDEQHLIVQKLYRTAKLATTPLQRWEEALAMPVSVFLLPFFAFANAGLSFDLAMSDAAFPSSITIGIVLGLVVGKAVGISSMTWLAIRTGLGRLPDDIDLRHILGISLLAGIGFTMSIFIAQLGFTEHPSFLNEAKLGIFLASVIAALCGLAVLAWVGHQDGERQFVRGGSIGPLS
jgi:NhaA family Na+:H+ antiporter